jgi:tetratricopeptide (TPR) repeat protein
MTLYDRIIHVCLWLIVFLVPFFFFPGTTDPIELNKSLLFFLLVLIAGVAWLMKLVVRKEGSFVRTPYDLPIVIVLLLSLLAAAFSLYRFRSFVGTSGYYSGSFVSLVFFVIFFALLVQTVRREHIGRYLNAFLLSGAVVVLFSFLQVFSFFIFPWDFSRIASFNGFSNSPATLTIYLAILVILSTYRFLSVLRRVDRHPLEAGLVGLLGLVSFFLLLVYDQPFGWLASILGLLLFLVFLTASSKHYEPSFLILPTVLIGLSLVALFVNTQALLRANLPGDVLLPSWIGSKVTLSSLKANPLLGFGQETFQAVFAKFRPAAFNDTAIWNLRFIKSSNEWFQQLVSIGILGAIAFFSIVVMSVWKIFRAALATPTDDWLWWHRLSLFAPALIIALSTFVLPLNFPLQFLFWLFCGLGVAGWREKDAAPPVKAPRGSGTSFAASLGFSLAVVLGIVFCYFAGRFWIADYKIARANAMIAKQEDLGKVRQLFADSIALNAYEQGTYFDLAQNLLVQAQLDAQNEKPDVNQLRTYITASVAAGQSGAQAFSKYSGSHEALAALYQDIDTLTNTTSEETKKAFLTAVELEPNNPQLLMNLGQHYLTVARQKSTQASEQGKDGKPDEQLTQEATTAFQNAQKAFEDASSKKTNYIEAKLNVALALRLQGKGDDAVSMLEDMAASNPFQVDTLFNLGENYLIDRRTADAETIFKRLIEIFPGHSDAHFRLAQIYEERGEKDAAIDELEVVLRYNPDNEDVKTKLAELKGTAPKE